jgi:hypothetical protein
MSCFACHGTGPVYELERKTVKAIRKGTVRCDDGDDNDGREDDAIRRKSLKEITEHDENHQAVVAETTSTTLRTPKSRMKMAKVLQVKRIWRDITYFSFILTQGICGICVFYVYI